MSDVKKLEFDLANAKKLIERRKTMQRLMQNRDFKTMILDGFCLTEAARYVQESADPMLAPNERQDALIMAQASGHLLRYCHVIMQMGEHPERTLPEIEAVLEEARQEEQAE